MKEGVFGLTSPITKTGKSTDWIKDSPWNSIEEFESELEASWEHMKQRGLELGILTQREDGALVGRGHPNKWFDAVEIK
jgi:hypothetical protein